MLSSTEEDSIAKIVNAAKNVLVEVFKITEEKAIDYIVSQADPIAICQLIIQKGVTGLNGKETN